MDNPTPHLFCFGFGFSANALANLFQAQGWRVSGTVRNADKQSPLQERGIVAHLYDEFIPLIHPESALSGVTHILISIPPQDNGDAVFNDYAQLISTLPNLLWLGYCSTTGVYGDHNGAWVDETTPVAPKHLRAKRRVFAESQWLSSTAPAHIFRLAGIYGPGRSAIETVQAADAQCIDKPGHVFCRIHVEDIAAALFASCQKPTPGEIFNLADDYPAPQAEVLTYAAKLLGIQPPPTIEFAKANLSEMARDFYAANRRVSSDKIKKLLGISWQYPSYKEGLAKEQQNRLPT